MLATRRAQSESGAQSARRPWVSARRPCVLTRARGIGRLIRMQDGRADSEACKSGPDELVLRWAEGVIGADARVLTVEGLNHGSRPWRLRIGHGTEVADVVLREVVPGWIGEQLIATGAAALQVAERHGLPAPRLLASDLAGTATGGVAATLETALPGSSSLPSHTSVARLRAAGGSIARVHGISLDPGPDLPLRTRPTQVDDHALERRWVTLYHASAEAEKPAVVAALRELTGFPAERAEEVLGGARATPLLQLADDRIRALDRPEEDTVFLHGDIWGGDMLWDSDRCLALIDWKTAGVGSPGVDLGELRMQMALQYGAGAPAQVLEGWQQHAGRQATAVAYWDIVAALNTPAVLLGWPGFDDDGRSLDAMAITRRRDDFLRTALAALDAG